MQACSSAASPLAGLYRPHTVAGPHLPVHPYKGQRFLLCWSIPSGAMSSSWRESWGVPLFPDPFLQADFGFVLILCPLLPPSFSLVPCSCPKCPQLYSSLLLRLFLGLQCRLFTSPLSKMQKAMLTFHPVS